MINRDSEDTFQEQRASQEPLLVHNVETIAEEPFPSERPIQEERQQIPKESLKEEVLTETVITSPAITTPVDQPKRERLVSLDAYRGLTMIGMIVVDHTIEGSCPWVEHKKWEGVTLADFIFPAFLFIMGMAIPLAVSSKRPINARNVARVVLLFLIGFLIELLGVQFNFQKVRVLGILQRMSLCYGAVLLLHYLTDYGENSLKRRVGGFVMVAIVGVYLFLMLTYEDSNIKNCVRGKNLTPDCNFAGYVDRKVLGLNHILERTDPEGIISTLTAVFATYMGYWLSMIMLRFNDMERTFKFWMGFSLLCLVGVYPLSQLMPLNKRLFSVSYLFLILSVSSLVLSLFLLLVDYLPKIYPQSKRVIHATVRPLIWMGLNPLIVFIVLQLLTFALQDLWKMGDSNAYEEFYRVAFKSWMTPMLASLVYDFFYLLIYLAFAWFLYSRKIFIRL